MMKTCEYLYGVKSLRNALDDESYESALNLKIKLSQILIKRLINVKLKDRDFRRINDSSDSQKFNKKLLDELK